MLKNIPKILTGTMLKALSDMGHGDVLIIADANFPGETLAKSTAFGELIRCPGVDVAAVYEAIHEIFPLDAAYTEHPAAVMELTDGDKAAGMPTPEAWKDFTATLHKDHPDLELGMIERFEFYKRAAKSYVIIETGEERVYGNLLLVKGVVL